MELLLAFFLTLKHSRPRRAHTNTRAFTFHPCPPFLLLLFYTWENLVLLRDTTLSQSGSGSNSGIISGMDWAVSQSQITWVGWVTRSTMDQAISNAAQE